LLFGALLVLTTAWLAQAVLVAGFLWRCQGIVGGFWAWLVPRRIWLHPSHLIDLKFFLVPPVLAAFGLTGGMTRTMILAASAATLVPSAVDGRAGPGARIACTPSLVPSDQGMSDHPSGGLASVLIVQASFCSTRLTRRSSLIGTVASGVCSSIG
jgi:hypothetical protein